MQRLTQKCGIPCGDSRIGLQFLFNPDYVLDHELHERTQRKIMKYIGLYLDENLFLGLFAVL